ncbi:NADPH-dependent FMN reductase [Pseudobacteriovorax antillogorgiicola]|uniref:NADPH-dependent FMN reductase n=1 Tax=Pseudobacteriovorax antillogorgiicola TaxID=1513793 RepID=UPI00104546F8|nr:NAD(P)H-dependent oxidoreductase [Pseudobacteriovorax antillogorgiicola]
MKITIVSGSHRTPSQSSRIGGYIEQQLKDMDPSLKTFHFNLGGNPLPLWDESVWSGGETWKKSWSPIALELQESDAFVFVVPEWGGMVPPGFKNFMLLCSNKELGHKPALLVSVSGSRNGAYPIAELRMTASKNNRVVFIPDHVIVRSAEHVLTDKVAESEEDQYLRSRLQYSLKILNQYGLSLRAVRESGVVDFESFPNGM